MLLQNNATDYHRLSNVDVIIGFTRIFIFPVVFRYVIIDVVDD